MAGLTERLQILITADASGAVREIQGVGRGAEQALKSTEDRIDRTGQQLTKFGAVAVAASGVAAAGLYELGSAASDLNEQTSRTRVVFGQASSSVEEFGRKAAASAGLSNTAALEAAGSFGTLFRGIGQTEQQAAESSVTFSKLAGDLASFSNTSPEQAVTALGAALRGESEPIRQYGVLLDDATLKNRALALGLVDTTTGTLPPAIRAQAAYAEVLAQTTLAQGDFARTSDSAANQQRVLKAEFENLKASIGQGVLPMMQALLGAANGVFGAFNGLSDGTKESVGQIAAVGVAAVAAVGGLSVLAGQVIKVRDRFRAADGTLNNFGKTAKGLGAIAATVAVLETVDAVMGSITDHAGKADDALQGLVASTSPGQAIEEWKEFSRQVGSSRSTMEEFSAAIGDAFGGDSNHDDQMKAFKRVLEESVPTAERLLAAMQQEWGADNVRDFTAALQEKKTADVQATVDQREYSKSVDEAADAMQRSTGALGEQSDALADAADHAKHMEDVLERIKDGQEAAAEAVRDHNSALLEGINSGLAYEGAVDRANDAVTAYRQGQDEAAEAVRKHGSASSEAAAAFEEADDALREVSGALLAQAVAAAEAQGATEGSAAANRIMRDELQKVADTLAPGDALRTRLEGYIARLGDVQQDITTELHLNAEQALADARRAAQDLDAILGGISVTPNAEYGGGRATGGLVMAGTSYRLGEYNRPELFTDTLGRQYGIPGEGRVSPLGATGSGGTSVTLSGNTFVNVGSARDVADEVAWAVRKAS